MAIDTNETIETIETIIKNIVKEVSKLTPEDVEDLMNFPISTEEKEVVFDVIEKDDNGAEISGSFKIHARIKKECYIFYNKVRYFGWTTQNGRAYKVDTIKLTMNSGHDTFTKTGTNTTEVKKLDEIYSNGSCDTAKLTVYAKKGVWRGEAEVSV